MSRRPNPFANPRARLALLFVSVLGALLVCEIGVRLLGLVPRVHAIWMDDPDSIYRRSANPLLGHELKPGFSREFPNGRATANSHGLRDRERSLTKPAGSRRILMLGDSVVEGVNYVADEDTLSRRLEGLMDGVEVLNFGTSGYCTLAEVELLEKKGLAFDPDEVVVVFTSNDFQNVVPEHTVAGGVSQRPHWAKVGFLRSALFRLFCLRFNWFAFGEEQDPVARNRSAIGANNVVDGFRRLSELANEHGFRVLIAVWPHFGEEKIEDFENERRIRLLVERLADMFGLPGIRLGRAFRDHHANLDEALSPRVRYTVNADGMHPNARAAGVVAAALKEVLLADDRKEPPYEPGAVDEAAVEEARLRGGADDIPEDMSFEQRAFLSLRYQGREQDSEDYLRGLIREEPDHLFANAWLGRFMAQKGRHEEAARCLRVAVAGQPAANDMRALLAESVLAVEGADAAEAVLAEGLTRHPADPHLRLAASRIHAARGDLARALEEVAAVLQVAPGFPGAEAFRRDLSTRER